jgi:hypothetical protein
LIYLPVAVLVIGYAFNAFFGRICDVCLFCHHLSGLLVKGARRILAAKNAILNTIGLICNFDVK